MKYSHANILKLKKKNVIALQMLVWFDAEGLYLVGLLKSRDVGRHILTFDTSSLTVSCFLQAVASYLTDRFERCIDFLN